MRDGKKEKEGKINLFCFLSHNILGHSQCVYKIWRLALIEAKKFVTQNLLEEKVRSTNKAMISSSRLILFYTIQQVIPNICTKFQNPRHSSSWEIFWHKFPYILPWSERWKKGKRRQKLITESWFSFSQYTWPLSRCIQNLKTLAVIRAENSVTKKLYSRERKMDKWREW